MVGLSLKLGRLFYGMTFLVAPARGLGYPFAYWLIQLNLFQGAHDLKMSALEFVVRNFATVKSTLGWKSIVEGHSKLLDEVLTNVLENGLGRSRN